MVAPLDLSGRRFGQLVALNRVANNSRGCAVWQCRCACGNLKTAAARDLVAGDTTRCRECGNKARRSLRHRPATAYTVNEDYFAAVDTPEKAYILGAILTDGCVTEHPNGSLGYLRFTIQAGDFAWLRAIRNALGSNHPIRCRTVQADRYTLPGGQRNREGYIASWGVSSRKLCEDLGRHGVHPRKTQTCTPWVGPDCLIRHFWRGVIDGDGALGIYHHGWVRSIQLCGTKAMCEGFWDWTASILGRRAGNLRPLPGPRVGRATMTTYRVTVFGCAACKAVAEALYGGDVMALDRKLAIAKEMMAWTLYRPGLPKDVTVADVEAVYAKAGGWRKAAKLMGMSHPKLIRLRRSLGMPCDPNMVRR